jgi:outer membrane autotransporter protein
LNYPFSYLRRDVKTKRYSMKKALSMICLVVLSIPAFSQISKGTSTIGGSFSLSRTKTEYPNNSEYTSNSFSLQPSYGYFFLDNFCVGAVLNFSNSNSTSNPNNTSVDSKSTSRSFGLGPFVRYYIPISDKFYAFGQLSYVRNWDKYEDWNTNLPNNKSINKFVSYDLGLAAGISYFLNPHVALDLALGYTHTKDSDRDPSAENYKANRIGLDAGIRVFLRKD